MFTLLHLPILTTIVAACFLVLMVRKAIRRPDPSLIWWAIGVFTYGLGTAIEGTIGIWGNSIALNKAWYVAGAVLGGYPLAQGTVYIMYKRRTADILTWITVAVIVITSVLVLLSPVNHAAFNPKKPEGAILAWTWVRFLVPVINLYAVIYLIGGAILSAIRFLKLHSGGNRVAGTVCIAIGGLLPGIGGSIAAAGIVEALYIGEFIGLLFLWYGTVVYSKRPKKLPETAAA